MFKRRLSRLEFLKSFAIRVAIAAMALTLLALYFGYAAGGDTRLGMDVAFRLLCVAGFLVVLWYLSLVGPVMQRLRDIGLQTGYAITGSAIITIYLPVEASLTFFRLGDLTHWSLLPGFWVGSAYLSWMFLLLAPTNWLEGQLPEGNCSDQIFRQHCHAGEPKI